MDEPYSDEVATAWRLIRRFEMKHLLELKKLLQEHIDPKDEGGAGVREPKPAPKPRGRPPKAASATQEITTPPDPKFPEFPGVYNAPPVVKAPK